MQPPTQINTMALTSAGPGWRAVARFKLTCYHAHFTRSTAGCTHTWSPQGDNAGNGERGGEGGGGALLLVRPGTNTHTGTGGRNAPPHSRHFPHRTPHMRSRTGDGLHQTQGRGQGSMAPGCTRAHTDQQTAKPQKRKQRAAHPPPGWRADGHLLHEHRHRRSKRIFACHLRCRGQHGAREGGHRQQAHTHKHTTAVTKTMAGARHHHHHHHHHPTTRAPSQSSGAVNGP